MDYEKKYNEALERARKAYQNIKPENTALKTMLKEAFPELAESEEERIRKEIINFLRSPFVTENITDEKIAPWVTYLEKQKEQKQTDLPAGFYVTMPDGKKYYTKEMRCNGMNVKVVEPKPAEWSEEDEEMVKEINHIVFGAGSVRNGMREKIHDWLYNRLKSLRPQPKKGLHPGSIRKVDNPMKWMEEDEKEREQKPVTWSEEDEEIFNNIIEKAKGGHWIEVNEITWLINRFKSLRPSWRPSEEQMDALHTAVYLEEMQFYGGLKDKLRVLYEQLKKL